ncbi:MAG: hypothetical protein IRZ04_07085 [Rhodospirillales bacterium]|nr:hypothetical protein [Rhodospirillales bacterium]
MRAIISGIAAAIAFGVIAGFTLTTLREPVYEAYSTTSTRVGDPGSNLVGRAWPAAPQAGSEAH